MDHPLRQLASGGSGPLDGFNPAGRRHDPVAEGSLISPESLLLPLLLQAFTGIRSQRLPVPTASAKQHEQLDVTCCPAGVSADVRPHQARRHGQVGAVFRRHLVAATLIRNPQSPALRPRGFPGPNQQAGRAGLAGLPQ